MFGSESMNKTDWNVRAAPILREFETDIFDATNNGWNGEEDSSEATNWTLPSSLLYSITLITTIGYGNIAPSSDAGRIATIIYAFCGIPLFFLWIGMISNSMAKVFRWFYKHVSHWLYIICCCKFSKMKTKRNENESPATAITTISNSTSLDLPPDMTLENNNDDILAHGREEGENAEVKVKTKSKIDQQKVHVPVIVCLSLMSIYIYLGALLFSTWERDWSILTGVYFCFITLTTIGLGDVVFGTNIGFENVGKIFMANFYLIFGLALIAMCFTLMQEDAIRCIRWIGKKLRFVKHTTASTD